MRESLPNQNVATAPAEPLELALARAPGRVVVDIGLAAAIALSLLTGYASLFSHIGFALLVCGAFWWQFRGFFLRAAAWSLFSLGALAAGAALPQHSGASAFELPFLLAALAVVFVLARRREAALAELRATQRAAEAANQAKTAYLSYLSHELRTPLTAILGYCYLVKQQIQANGMIDTTRDIEQINSASRHMQTLLNDVLDLAKIEAGHLALSLDTFEIAPLVQNVLATVRPLAERFENTLQADYGDDLGSMVADPTKVQQILLNLLSNAAKFTQSGTISLRAWREPAGPVGWVVFEIADTGVGISPEHLGCLFEPFMQLADASHQEWRGTGLGLALSRQFSRRMGGDITVQSAPGVGSTFTVRLPALVVAPTIDAPTLGAAAQPGQRPLTAS